MNKLGRKEIKKALDNIKFTKNEYEAYEIDKLIMQYYKINHDEFDELTEKSYEFNYITDVYEYIDELLTKKGFKSEDMLHYINTGEHINEIIKGQRDIFGGIYE